MPTTEMTHASLDAAEASVPAGHPVFMVNLLRYNEQARYGAAGDFPPCSGREAYFARYVPAFAEAAGSVGIKPIWVGNVHAGVVAPAGERWDDVAIVEYPSFDAFRKLIESEAYQAKADLPG